MNNFAAYYALNKVKKELEQKINSLKAELISNDFSEISTRPDQYCNSWALRDKIRGHYRVNFGDIRANVFYDGQSFFSIYKAPREPRVEVDEKKETVSLLPKERLCESLGLKKKSSYIDIIKSIEAIFPGIITSTDLKTNTIDILSSAKGNMAPSVEAAALDIGDPYYELKIKEIRDAVAFTYPSPLDGLEFLKKMEKKFSAMVDFLSVVCKNNFEPNDYLSFSTQQRINYDDEALSLFIEQIKDDALVSLIAEKKEKVKKTRNLEIGYCASISEIGEYGLSSDLIGALQLISSNQKPQISQENNEKNKVFFENKKTGKISR